MNYTILLDMMYHAIHHIMQYIISCDTLYQVYCIVSCNTIYHVIHCMMSYIKLCDILYHCIMRYIISCDTALYRAIHCIIWLPVLFFSRSMNWTLLSIVVTLSDGRIFFCRNSFIQIENGCSCPAQTGHFKHNTIRMFWLTNHSCCHHHHHHIRSTSMTPTSHDEMSDISDIHASSGQTANKDRQFYFQDSSCLVTIK